MWPAPEMCTTLLGRQTTWIVVRHGDRADDHLDGVHLHLECAKGAREGPGALPGPHGGEGAAKSSEDLPPFGEVPVAEGRPRDQRSGRERTAAEDAITRSEEELGVLLVREALEAGVG
jgi:hypothetical protein